MWLWNLQCTTNIVCKYIAIFHSPWLFYLEISGLKCTGRSCSSLLLKYIDGIKHPQMDHFIGNSHMHGRKLVTLGGTWDKHILVAYLWEHQGLGSSLKVLANLTNLTYLFSCYLVKNSNKNNNKLYKYGQGIQEHNNEHLCHQFLSM